MSEDLSIPAVPEAVPEDPEDVSWALSTAEAMWARGDHAEGIKWVRRAAEAASEAENDNRALQLAKAAADLASMIARMSHASVDLEEIEPEPALARPPKPPPPPKTGSSSRLSSAPPSVAPTRPQPTSVTKQVSTPSRPPAPLPSRTSQPPPKGKPLGTNTQKPSSIRPAAKPADKKEPKKLPRRSRDNLEAVAVDGVAKSAPSVPAPAPVPAVLGRASVPPSVPPSGSVPSVPGRASVPPSGSVPSVPGRASVPPSGSVPSVPGRASVPSVPGNASVPSPSVPDRASVPASARAAAVATDGVPRSFPATPAAAIDLPVDSERIGRPPRGHNDPTLVEPRHVDELTRPKRETIDEWDASPTQDLTGEDLPFAPFPSGGAPDGDNYGDRATTVGSLGVDLKAALDKLPAEGPGNAGPPSGSAPPVTVVGASLSPLGNSAASSSRTPASEPHDPGILTSQAVQVVVWRDASGVHVAPAGTVVSAITVDAILVALEPHADLTAWLSKRSR